MCGIIGYWDKRGADASIVDRVTMWIKLRGPVDVGVWLNDEDFFDPVPIRKMWQEHVTGKRRWHYCLWDVLMFQAWLESAKEI